MASEFLQEHWRKLFLCLGVLLIVVSSTVGAQHVLGPLFWTPEGKCAVALVYTVLVAVFGRALVRWGATTAGRMIAFTALALIAVNSALVGEVGLLHALPAAREAGWVVRILVLAVEIGTLLLLSQRILAAPNLRAPRFFWLAFFALSAANALLAPGISRLQSFAGLLFLATLFLTATWRCNTRWRKVGAEAGDAYAALGLLTYAFLFGMARAGLLVMDPVPTLYALPLMLVGVACLDTGHHLEALDPNPHRTGLFRYGGCVLAGGAFVLALARPPEPSALFSGNTLATALLGLALFASSLRQSRHPAYLYASFAALVVAYFGTGYFIADLVAAIEETARRALGYEQSLPTPFKALNGIAFNVLLALLALRFCRAWKEERLARHCHAIGLPLAVAACVYSCFEAKAAVLCLPAYAVLFGLAAAVFSQPRLVYLVCGAVAGGAFSASRMVPDLAPEALALGAAGIGLAFGLTERVLARARVDTAYRTPLAHSGLAMVAASWTLIAILFVFLQPVAPWKGVLLTVSAASLLVNGTVLLWLATFWRAPALVYAALTALVSAVHLSLLAVGVAGPGVHGAVAAVLAIALWGVGLCCQRGATAERDVLYGRPLWGFSLLLTLFAVPMGINSATAMLFLAVAFLLPIRSFPAAEWLYGAVGCAAIALYRFCLAWPPDARWVIALVAAAYGLWALGTVVRRARLILCARLHLPDLGYELPLFNTALAAGIGALVLRVGGSLLRGESWGVHVALLPVLGLFSLLMLGAYPHRAWLHVAVALFTASVALKLAPLVTDLPYWLLVGMVLAHLWLLIARALQRVETPFCERLSIPPDQYSEAVRAWSRGLFAISVLLLAVLVGVTVLSAVFLAPVRDVDALGRWAGCLFTLALAALYLQLATGSKDATWRYAGHHAVLLLAVWWLGVLSAPHSVFLGIHPHVYFPLVTITLALALTVVGEVTRRRWRSTQQQQGTGARSAPVAAGCEPAPEFRNDFERCASIGLTVVALAFTRGTLDAITVLVLLLATATFTTLVFTHHRIAFGPAAGVAFTAAGVVAALVAAGAPHIGVTSAAGFSIALGAALPALVLVLATGSLRRLPPKAPGRQSR